ncbi:MAG TPA: AAA-associated domain-containing protein [Bryobacteraceae bacterium]|nr:AAA-associated domain-containing protein [Bryobacteraceae bacterium]
MSHLPTDKLRALISRGEWEPLIEVLMRLDPVVAADFFLELPVETRNTVFQRLPIGLAARLAEIFPYYDTYVLLHSRSLQDLNGIVDAMDPARRLQFFDELPESSWQTLMDELADGGAAARGAAPSIAPAAPRVEAIIQARQIEKAFQRPDGGCVQVIAPTDLSVEPGMIIALLGPSGSGKSTLLRMLSGLGAPTAGEVLWHGRPMEESRPNVAIVFQSFALFPWLTVAENVEVPLLARGMTHDVRHRKALQTLESVGLSGFENAYPKELSGGMKQRVGFARALAVEPEILFMDEPFSALDVLTAENLRGELMELWLGKKIPTRSIFLVTHNIEEAVMLGDRIIVLGKNPARIRADFRIPMRQPRVRTDAEFLLYVDYIYKLLTQPQLQAETPSPTALAAKTCQMLPHARRGAIAGLLELLNDRGGKEDLYRVADELRMEVDDLLPVVEAATLLKFAKSDRGDVEITPLGKAFAEADIAARKSLFREAILANVHLIQQIGGALSTKTDHTMPLEFFRDIIQEHFSSSEGKRQIETALNWGRYADLFSYDSESDRLSLHPHDTEAVREGAPEP